METNTNLRISIPKPCHEDWNKLTPDEKGAFCKVCSKSVHDFTKKSVEEISTILIEEMSAGKKVCGRFNEDQLTPVETQNLASHELSPYVLNFTRLKKFTLALFLVFGGYLFSIPKTYAQKMGKVAYQPRPEQIKGEVMRRYPEPTKDTVKPAIDTTTIEPKASKQVEMLGDVSVVRPIEPVAVMGGICINPVPASKDTAQTTITNVIPEDTTAASDSLIKDEPIVMGEPAFPYDRSRPIIEEEPDSVTGTVNDSTLTEELAVPESTFVEMTSPFPIAIGTSPAGEGVVLECYPNPSKGFVNLKYSVKENVQTSIMLYDVNGNFIKTLVEPQNMYAADYSSQFDINELSDGIYFCALQSGDKITTKKIILGK